MSEVDNENVPPDLEGIASNVIEEFQDQSRPIGEPEAGSRAEQSIKRSRKPTEKGEQYQEHLVEQMITRSKKHLENQFRIVEYLLDEATNITSLERESCKLDELFSTLLDAAARKRELMRQGDLESVDFDKMIHNLDEKLFMLKHKVSDTIKKLNQDTKSKLSSKVSVSSHVSQSSLKQQSLIADLEAKRQTMIRAQENEIKAESAEYKGSVGSRVSSRSRKSIDSHVSRSSVKQQALIAGLEAERHAMIKVQQAEIQAEVLRNEEERKLAIQLKASEQRANLLRMEEQIAKAKAMEAVYREEEMKQEMSADRKSQSRSSKVSTLSRVSNRSSIAKKAELAGLRAEIEAKKKTQEVEFQAEELKAEAEAKSTRNTKCLTQKLELLEIEKRIAKEKAIGNVLKQSANSEHCGPCKISSHSVQAQKDTVLPRESANNGHCGPCNISSHSAQANPKQKQYDDISYQAQSILDMQNSIANNDLTPLVTESMPVEQATTNRITRKLTSQSADTLTAQLSRMIKQQAAPDVEIDAFSGDLLEYTYFISNFKEIVESSVDSQRGRLNRLIKFTTGEAKELIKHCSEESATDCYDQALFLLNREYGNKYKIACAYMEELRKWPQIKQNDANAFKKFYRFLLRCMTIQKRGELDILNSPMSIRQLQLKLPTPQQDKCPKIVETTPEGKREEKLVSKSL